MQCRCVRLRERGSVPSPSLTMRVCYLEKPLARQVHAFAHASSYDTVNQARTRERIALIGERSLHTRPESSPACFDRRAPFVRRNRLHADGVCQARASAGKFQRGHRLSEQR